MRPHRWKPTRLPHPWDPPGKNIGVGCHFLLQCMKVKSEKKVAQLCPTLSDPMDYSLPGSSIHGIFQARVLEWGAIAFSGDSSWKILNVLVGTSLVIQWLTLHASTPGGTGSFPDWKRKILHTVGPKKLRKKEEKSAVILAPARYLLPPPPFWFNSFKLSML